MRNIIIDDLTEVPISKQRKYQIRKKRAGLCTLCGRKAFKETVWCYDHHVKHGVLYPGRNKRKSEKELVLQTRKQHSAYGQYLFLEG
jgi:hypothetical protein